MRRLTLIVVVLSGLLTFDIALAQNNPPALDAIGAQSVDEGARLDIRVAATDPDAGDVITLTAESYPANASFADSSGGVGGFTFQPDYTQSGNYQIRFIASDAGGLADTELVDIAVNNIDRAPVWAAVAPQSVAENGHLGVRVSATDADGDAITLIAESLPPNAAFADSGAGIGGIVFDPGFTQAGSYQVRIIATSMVGASPKT